MAQEFGGGPTAVILLPRLVPDLLVVPGKCRDLDRSLALGDPLQPVAST